jgi:quinol monooxygenase YgiN
MRYHEEVRFVIDIEITDPVRFRELVLQCVEISRQEPGTLVYDWYIAEDGAKGCLYETYESPDALRTHTQGRVFSEVGPKLMEVCRFLHVDAFGDFGPQARRPPLWPTTYWGMPFAAVSQ